MASQPPGLDTQESEKINLEMAAVEKNIDVLKTEMEEMEQQNDLQQDESKKELHLDVVEEAAEIIDPSFEKEYSESVRKLVMLMSSKIMYLERVHGEYRSFCERQSSYGNDHHIMSFGGSEIYPMKPCPSVSKEKHFLNVIANE